MKEQALNLIRRVLQEPGSQPAVLWSSGKDSMALLHLVRQVRADVPVILLREPWQPQRYAFANRIIEEWQLAQVHDLNPQSSFVCTRNGHTSLIHRYQFGGKGLDLPVDIEELPNTPWVCGLDVMNRPKATSQSAWNVLFSGARSADADQLLGAMPLISDLVRQPGFPTMVFPMREWSDSQTWDYLETERVPIQSNRYEKRDGRWRERPDHAGNPDYLAGCVRCLQPGETPSVSCFKHGVVNRIHDMVPKIEDPLPFYIAKP